MLRTIAINGLECPMCKELTPVPPPARKPDTCVTCASCGAMLRLLTVAVIYTAEKA